MLYVRILNSIVMWNTSDNVAVTTRRVLSMHAKLDFYLGKVI